MHGRTAPTIRAWNHPRSLAVPPGNQELPPRPDGCRGDAGWRTIQRAMAYGRRDAGADGMSGTLLDVLEQGRADAPALVVPEGPRLTYAALRQEVRRAADAFAAYGLGRGDRIALVLPNGAELVVG